ncbi:MAG TPA: efflux RND transporter periplasmic adaptor subunit [Phycisphaerae bacterium]|nr:efflux RND transporter periplasmic adaptor subunit [Phycisphaerae bacterium]HNU45102.1 efflux RND transporter periplasmic adaptor subunit [Phycisphaerae bacterium]
MLRVLLSLFLVTALLAAGTAIAGWLFATRELPPERQELPLPPLVATFTLAPRQVTETFTGYGSARAERRTTVAAQVAGTVVDLPGRLRPGATVEDGQPIIQLDDREYRHDLDRAQAQVAADQAQLDQLGIEETNIQRLLVIAEKELRIAGDERDRLARLFETDLAHKRELDLARLAYEQVHRVWQSQQNEAAVLPTRRVALEAALRGHQAAAGIAQLNLERCTIRAPFPGAIEELYVEVGDRVGPGTPLLVLMDTNRLEVAVHLPVGVRDGLRVGATCTLQRESNPRTDWHGAIARLAPAADTQTRTFAAYVLLNNTEQPEPLLPGAFVRATVEGPRHEAALLIPRGAIRNGRVLVAQAGYARGRQVTVDRFVQDEALIIDGLSPGEEVILAPLDVLTDGSPIRMPTTPPTTPTAGIPAAPDAGTPHGAAEHPPASTPPSASGRTP